MQITPIYSILCLVLFNAFILDAQDVIFAYAYNANGSAVSLDSKSSDKFGSKFAITQSILNDLIQAKGNLNMPSPKLEINNGEQKPAYIDLKSGTIYLEEKAFDICQSMGKDASAAIATLLAHELTHYYEKHDWKDHFIQHYGSNLKESNSAVWDEQLQLELQADQLGGFLANMAGYNTSGVLKPLMEKIYESYNLNSNADSSYPSLSERIDIALQGEKQMDIMHKVFKMSTYLTLIGEYETAFKYLDQIVVKSKFQSRELHNNRGVLLALSALSYFGEDEMPFVIPLELDLNTRLSRKSIDKALRDNYLRKAEKSLQSTITLDDKYWPAYVNLASVFILKGDYFEASYQCQKLIKKADHIHDAEQVAHAYINLAIIDYLEGDINSAAANFEKASAYDGQGLSNYNLSILNGEPLTEKVNTKPINASSGGINLNQYFSKIMQGEIEATTQVEISNVLNFFVAPENESSVFISLNDWGDGGYHLFQITRTLVIEGDTLTYRTHQNRIEELLGAPAYASPTTNGKASYYKNANLIVKYCDGLVDEFILIHRD